MSVELFYNPAVMPEDEIKATFVAREWLVDELVSIIRRQPAGAGMQHVAIIAPRGMGKTTLLLMLRFAIRDSNLAKRWQPVRFPEESYNVNDLADLWLATLLHLAEETDDPALAQRAEQLNNESGHDDDLAAAAYALIKDWVRKHKRRLVLLIDNFDMVLGQIGDERENARLRDVLMNDGAVMLIGTGTAYFKEARRYDQPLYNFFRPYDLAQLSSEDTRSLLGRRASLDGVENFDEILKAKGSKLRVLEYFTGGNPRLVLMLYRILTQSDVLEVRKGLEKLLDEVTPYYKAKIETLPPQQRKILDHIARVSSQTHEGDTPTGIGKSTRMPVNQVSVQLKRLSDHGYVRSADVAGKNSYYTLSEPLYAIWHQMRFGSAARQRMSWLIDFLRGWYEALEIGQESRRLEDRFQALLASGLFNQARSELEYRGYLADAVNDMVVRSGKLNSIISDYLKLADVQIPRDVIQETSLPGLSRETLETLVERGCVTPAQQKRAIESVFAVRKAFDDAGTAMQAGEPRKAIEVLEPALSIANSGILVEVLAFRGLLFMNLGEQAQAMASYESVLQLNPRHEEAWFYRGCILATDKKYDQALESFGRIDLGSEFHTKATLMKMVALGGLGRTMEAFGIANQDFEIKAPADAGGLFRGIFHLYRFISRLVDDHLDEARAEWMELVDALPQEDKTLVVTSDLLVPFAALSMRHFDFVEELIMASHLQEHLFPLQRAIRFVRTRDDSLIKKLSPEVRGAVNQIVADIERGLQEARAEAKPLLRKSKLTASRKGALKRA